MFWKKLLGWVKRVRWGLEVRFGWLRKWQERRKKVAFEKRVASLPKVMRPKLIWNKGCPGEAGTYIVRHRGKVREAVLKGIVKVYKADFGMVPGYLYGWVINFRDKVFMKGVTAWRPAPENLIKIF